MALRYAIELDNAALLRVEPDKVVPRFSAPGRVEFRPGANIGDVVEDLLTYERVQLCAAVGAGKSVRVPEAISKAVKGLVVHCVPSPLLALNLHRYVSTKVKVDTKFVDGDPGPLPTKGIAFTGSADMVRRVLEWRGKGEEPPPFVLFLDECHESDCFTEVLRSLGSALPGVTNLVLSSATFDPDGARRVEAAGKRVDKVLPDMIVEDWDPEDDDKPWSFSNLGNDTMIFVEKPAVRDKMHASYKENGFMVFNLSSRMSTSEFSHILDVLESRNRPVVVLMADYSFRSGHTFPSVVNFIDSGMVKYYSESNGSPAAFFRNAYKFEVEQAAGRGGRVPGTSSVCWKPARSEAKMCDLEGTEVDAAALLYRMLGFKPPRLYAQSSFYSGLVPDDLHAAFKGKMPLFTWRKEHLTEWVGGCIQPVKPDIPCVPVYKPTPIKSQRPNFKVRSSIDGIERPFTPPSPDLLPAAPIRRVRSRELVQPPPSPVSVMEAPERVDSPLVAMKPRMSVAGGDYSEDMAQAFELEATPTTVSKPQFESFPEVVGKKAPLSVLDSSLSEPFDVLGKMIDGLEVVTGPDIPVGEYRFFPGVERCDSKSKVYHGIDSVHRLVRKPAVVEGLDYGERMAAVKLLLDEYNGAVSRIKAIRRITVALPNVTHMFGGLVDPSAMRVWAEGVSERLTEDRAIAKTYSDDMLCLFATGYVAVSGPMAEAYERKEVEYVNGYLRQLETVVADHDPSGQDDYALKVLEQPKKGVLLSSIKQKMIMPSERARASRDFREVGPAGSRELMRTDKGQSVPVAKYRLQPNSGLPSLVARALFKTIGEGDVRMHVK